MSSTKCIVKNDDGQEITIHSKSKLPFNESIEIDPIFEQQILKIMLKTQCNTLINGYKMLINKVYEFKPTVDCLRIDGKVFYINFVTNDKENLKRSRSEDSVEEKLNKVPKLAPMFQPKTTSEHSKGSWSQHETVCIFTPKSWINKSLIAGFDLDSTLIKTKSGKVFPINNHDWMFFTPNIPKKLVEYCDKGYSVNIFTNQLTAGQSPSNLTLIKDKINNILKQIECPIRVFMALKRDYYRKPAPGMWKMLEELQNDITIDYNKSFYVGDAAGRTPSKQSKIKPDHSSADRLFALNIGLKFETPEELFLKLAPLPYKLPEFDPRNLKVKPVKYSFPDEPEVIFMVGSPGSGKSVFCNEELIPRGYRYISRDELNSWQRCATILQDAIKNKESVVLDNTHKDVESRKKYLDLVKSNKITARCFVMPMDKNMVRHNNMFRQITDKKHAVITDTIIHSYFKQYQEPTIKEGFQEIVHVQFQPCFKDEEKEKLYKMFLLEK